MGHHQRHVEQDHTPNAETLSRLADYSGTDGREILQIAGLLLNDDEPPGAEAVGSGEHLLTQQFTWGFQKVPDEWKREAVGQMKMFVRLGEVAAPRLVENDATERGQKTVRRSDAQAKEVIAREEGIRWQRAVDLESCRAFRRLPT